MRPLANLFVLACPLALAAVASGCGSGGSTTSVSSEPRVANVPAPPRSDFPAAQGKTFGEIVESAEHAPYAVEPQATAFYEGLNRYPFGVSEREGHAQANDSEVALYFAKVPTLHPKFQKTDKGLLALERIKAMEAPAIGPFPASIESLETKPAFRSAATAEDPEAARGVYASQVDLPSDGDWRAAAVFREGDGYGVTVLPDVVVGELHRLPRVGQAAPSIQMPGNDGSGAEYDRALGKKPIVLLFTTPKFCQSRVCGPVADAAEQVKHRYGEKAEFIQMETYNEKDPSAGISPEAEAFHLPSEPWLFAIGSDGVVDQTIEGAVGVDGITRAAKRAISE